MGTTHCQWSSVTDNVVEEFDDLGATQVSNTHLPEEFGELVAQHDTETHFHHYDDRGSTVAITDEAGDVEDEFEYNAYGEEVAHTGASETPYRFQGAYGYYTDTELGSIYIRRRTYLPMSGRWASVDPLGFVDGVNLYGAHFVANTSDPSGLKKMSPAEALGGVDSCTIFALVGHTTWVSGVDRNLIKRYTKLEEPKMHCFARGIVACQSARVESLERVPHEIKIPHWPLTNLLFWKASAIGAVIEGIELGLLYADYNTWCENCDCEEIRVRVVCQPDFASFVQSNGGDLQVDYLGVTADKLCGNAAVDTPVGRMRAWEDVPYYVGDFKVPCSDLPKSWPGFNVIPKSEQREQ